MHPSDCQVTVIGGGAVGAAAAYFLASAGYREVQLLEAGALGSATTGQAAGLLGQSRTTLERTRLAMASAKFFRNFEVDLGHTADWRETGSLRIAMSAPAIAELTSIAAIASAAGLDVHLIDAARVQELCPTLEDVSSISLALWVPSDGYVQPNSLVNAYIAAAKDLGVNVCTQTPVVDVEITEGAVSGVVTTRGRVSTKILINAAGPWAGALARKSGIELPVVPVLHEYFVTEPQDGWHSGLPNLRIPEIGIYARGEGRGILCGGFERNGTSIDPSGVDLQTSLPDSPNWEVLGQFAEELKRFVPSVVDAGIQTAFYGWPGFTPDGRFIVGPVAGIKGYVMAAGCNAHGVSGSAGLARHLVESLSTEVSPYVESLSPNRFIPRTWQWSTARTQAQAICENYYPMPSLPQ